MNIDRVTIRLPEPQVFAPFSESGRFVMARSALRSSTFAASAAGGGAGVVVGSAAGFDLRHVKLRARGELVERAGNILAGRAAETESSVIGSYRELRRQGRPALDPRTWPELSTAADVADARMLWVEGESLTSQARVLVPASMVFLHHIPPPDCQLVLRATSCGLAAHESTGEATRHALLEVAERHQLFDVWYGESPVQAVEPDVSLPSYCADTLSMLALRCALFAFTGPAGAVCLVAGVCRVDSTEQTFGAKCVVGTDADTTASAAVAAVSEALMVRWSMASPVATEAWQRMRRRLEPCDAADGPLEHALGAFHSGVALGRLLTVHTRCGDRPTSIAPVEGQQRGTLGDQLAEATGADVVRIETSFPGVDRRLRVVRVVAPGARRLPAREVERRRGTDPPPHPFG